jgi:hypothetical protein
MDAVLRLPMASEVWLARSVEADVPIEATLPRLWDGFLANAVRLARRDLRAGATMWKNFTSRTPAEIERARRDGDHDTRRLLLNYAMLFPTVHDDGRVDALSFVDRRILGALSTDRWSGAPEVFVKQRAATSPVFDSLGARFVLARLWRWAGWRKGVFVERRLKPSAETLAHAEYRLSSRGAALLDGKSPVVSPPVQVGGVTVSAGAATWGCAAAEVGEWRLVRVAKLKPRP